IYKKKIEKEQLTNLFYNIEIPLIRVLKKIEKTGVYVDRKELQQLSNKFQLKMSKLTSEIFEIAGSQFNLNSTQQLSKVLFEDLGIEPIKKTKTGFSTNSAVLEELSEKHKIAKLMIEFRKLAKLESTYTISLQSLVNEDTGRIHSSFHQAGTSTGRLSSSNPNLQNIPIRTEEGQEIRKVFRTKDDSKFIIAADYSQIELRLMALFSRDPNMLEAYKNDQDIHSQTASLVFDKSLDDVSREDRSRAKVINFGLLYGMGARTLAKELKIKQKEAKIFIDNYFNKFPSIKDFKEKAIADARENGFASTLFGRKLFLPALANPSSYNNRQLSGSERVAVNMPIQGTAADLIKIAMINIDNEISDIDGIDMLIQVHDELVFEVEKNLSEKAEEIIRRNMEEALPEKYRKIIRLKVDIGYGKNWFEAH
ncbi:MAG: DNA polymerase, partial [Candidatus Cloacimonadota bacterium]|nr:DNA polymerase [Candidatus Cloacimonadota bacterium]